MSGSSPAGGACAPATAVAAADPAACLNSWWRSRFLAALAETSNVTAASAAAGVPSSRAYKLRRVEPDFARAWTAALLEGYEHLELELLHRLRFGEPRETPGRFDNASALRLLAMHRETVARERALRENEDVETVRASLRDKVEKLREQVLARRPGRKGAK